MASIIYLRVAKLDDDAYNTELCVPEIINNLDFVTLSVLVKKIQQNELT